VIVVSVLCHLDELRKIAMQVHKLVKRAVMRMSDTYIVIRFRTSALTGGFLAWTGRDEDCFARPHCLLPRQATSDHSASSALVTARPGRAGRERSRKAELARGPRPAARAA
jgi:hypothetical protein